MPSERIQRRIETLLDEADAAVAQSNWALVRDRALNVLALDRGNADALAYVEAADYRRQDRVPPAADPPAAVSSSPATSPVDAAPTPVVAFANGRYQVTRLLGEGATKRVYLAHDTRLDRDVAFALIRTEGLDKDGLARIRREA